MQPNMERQFVSKYITPVLGYFANLSNEQRSNLSFAEKKRMVGELKTNFAAGVLGADGSPFQLHCIQMLRDVNPPKPKQIFM